MEPQLVRLDVLLFASFLDQLSGQFGAFPRGHHPADDIPAEDIEDDVKVKVGPLGGTTQLGDVPTPQLIGGSAEDARRQLGPLAIVGLSVETVEQARAAALLDVDYLGVGPVFPTATKTD